MKASNVVLILATLLIAGSAKASHFFGVDFFYTHVSGNTYTITAAIYGDCSGSAFPTFGTASPEVEVFDGSTLLTTMNLSLDPPPVEVTPVCPQLASHTTCVDPSGTIPGITRYMYSGTITLPHTSTLWRFVFTGNLTSSTAGRSNGITNILIGGSGSVVRLTDTLNNAVAPNSGARYTTIPTPFYCQGNPANFNPGAIDADGDNLFYQLVPGVDLATSTGFVNYISPFTATMPIAAVPGSFSFSMATGQLAFTPNITQKALVVYNVREMRGGVFMGNTQREMSVVVLNSCTNTPPGANIAGVTTGALTGINQLTICGSAGGFSFNLNPTDPDGDTISMVATGLPGGSTLTIINNGTPAPTAVFNWTTTGVVPGTYTFFVTYSSPACPLQSMQTIAYTIVIGSALSVTAIAVSNVHCAGGADGSIVVTTVGGQAPNSFALNSFSWQPSGTFAGLTAGTYVINVKDASGCSVIASAVVSEPAPLLVTSINITHPTCDGFADGAVNASASGGTPPYLWSVDGSAFAASSLFDHLTAGNYTIYVKDSNGCRADGHAALVGFPPILPGTPAVIMPTCNGHRNGAIYFSASGGTAPLLYKLSGTSGYVSTDSFFALAGGDYTITVKDAKGCVKDVPVVVPQPARLHVNFDVTNNDCQHGPESGAIAIVASGGTPPYAYSWSNLSTATSINHLANGKYVVKVVDTNGCTGTDSAQVVFDDCCKPYFPNAFTPNNDGNNDVFRLHYIGDMKLIDLSIYNRFGELVFLTEDFNAGWDGTFRGVPVDIGAYYFYARIVCGNKGNKQNLIKGDITLIR